MIKTSEHQIKDLVGIHARPAGKLITLLKPHKSKVTLLCGNKQIDARSLLAMMKACIKCGDIVAFVIDGEDENDVNAVLMDFLENNF